MVAASRPVTGEFGGRQRDQAERSHQARDPQQADRRQLVHERPGEVPHHEHQRADVDEQQDARHVDRAAEREVDPLARRELGRGGQEHRAEQDEEQRVQQLAEHLSHRHAGRRALGGRKPHAERQAR